MTEEQIQEEKEFGERSYPGQKDWLFESLVNAVNNSEGSIGVTITLSGQVVSGTLIGVRRYFDLMKELGNEDSLFAGLHKFKEQFYSVEDLNLRSENAIMSSYFHLTDASFYTDAEKPFPLPGTLFRGKISDVNGFMFGVLGRQKQ